MQFISVFGVNYYLVLENVPKWVQHALRLITDRWGNDLDAVVNGVISVPDAPRHKANLLLRRYGVLNV